MFKNTLPLTRTLVVNQVRSAETCATRLVFTPLIMRRTVSAVPSSSPPFSSNVSRRTFATNSMMFQETNENSAQNDDIAAQYLNISAKRFPDETARILLDKINEDDIEIKPDGIIYLPEIKYRRILNLAFGPGGWGLVPRGNYKIERGYVCQQYALFCNGQFVSQAWGDQTYEEEGKMSYKSLATALEGAKSNALMRCCKDLGIASELWDPAYILKWKAEHAVEVWAVHQKTNQRKKLYRRRDRPAFEYPYVEDTKGVATSGSSSSSKYGKGSKLTSAAPMDGEPLVENPEDIQIAGVDIEPNEEEDVGMFDNMFNDDATSTAATSSANSKFNWNEQIKFGKYKGRSWTEAMKDKKFKSYLSWLIDNGKATPQVKAAIEMME